MKNIFKYLAIAAMGIALMGMVACKEKPEADLYAFHYNGESVEDGATVYFIPSFQQTANNWASVEFFMENKTEGNLETVMKVERVSGPAALDNLSICYGETCKTGICPWTSDPFTLVPGINTNMKVVLDYTPSIITEPSVYRITIGKGTAMESPRVMLIDITGE